MSAHAIRSTLNACLVGCLFGAVAAVQAAAVGVGGQTFNIPGPEGLVQVPPSLAEYHKAVQRLTPPRARLLAIFLEPADVQALRRGQAPGSDRSAVLQTPRDLEEQRVSVEGFATLRDRIRTQATQQSLDRAAAAANQHVEVAVKDLNQPRHSEVSSRLDRMLGAGVFEESDTSISMLVLSDYTLGGEGETRTLQMAQASSFVLVKGKVLVLLVYSPLRAPSDMEWVRGKIRRWQAQVLAANR